MVTDPKEDMRKPWHQPGVALKKSLLLTRLQFLPWDDQGSNTLPPTHDSGVDHHQSGGKKHPNFYWTGKGSKFLTGALRHSNRDCVSLHDGACRVLTLSENDCSLTETVTCASVCMRACVCVCVVRVHACTHAYKHVTGCTITFRNSWALKGLAQCLTHSNYSINGNYGDNGATKIIWDSPYSLLHSLSPFHIWTNFPNL